jgi:hypothetical protein
MVVAIGGSDAERSGGYACELSFELWKACFAREVRPWAIGHADLFRFRDGYEAAVPDCKLISKHNPISVALQTIQLQQHDAVGEVIQQQKTQGHVSEILI